MTSSGKNTHISIAIQSNTCHNNQLPQLTMMSIARYTFGLVLALSTTSSSAENNLRTPRKLQTYSSYDGYYQQMLDAVNAERAKAGLSALCTNQKLANAAARHSKDMAENNFMGHEGSDGSTLSSRITDAGYSWNAVAENVAAGQEDVASVMESWMNSAGHRANILGADYTMFGTSYVYNAKSTYGHYWTQDFAAGESEICENGSPSTSQSTEQTQEETQSTNDENDSTSQSYSPPSTGYPTTFASPSSGGFSMKSFFTKSRATETPVQQNTTKVPISVTPSSDIPAPVTPASINPTPVTPASINPTPVTPASIHPALVNSPWKTVATVFPAPGSQVPTTPDCEGKKRNFVVTR
ncbi:putative CAP domain-containing protein [Plasmopara halstedii]